MTLYGPCIIVHIAPVWASICFLFPIQTLSLSSPLLSLCCPAFLPSLLVLFPLPSLSGFAADGPGQEEKVTASGGKKMPDL